MRQIDTGARISKEGVPAGSLTISMDGEQEHAQGIGYAKRQVGIWAHDHATKDTKCCHCGGSHRCHTDGLIPFNPQAHTERHIKETFEQTVSDIGKHLEIQTDNARQESRRSRPFVNTGHRETKEGERRRDTENANRTHPPPKQNEYKEKGDSAGEQVPKRPRIHVLTYEHRAPDERYKNRSGTQTIERIAEQAHWYIDDSPCDIQHQELLYGLADTEARPTLPVRELPYIQAPKAQKCRCDKEERDGDTIDTLDKGGCAKRPRVDLYDQKRHEELHDVQIGKHHPLALNSFRW